MPDAGLPRPDEAAIAACRPPAGSVSRVSAVLACREGVLESCSGLELQPGRETARNETASKANRRIIGDLR
jgi:hypothetical protein